MIWVKAKDYYDYDFSKDKSYFRVIVERRLLNDIFLNKTSVNISVKNVEKGFIYPEQP
jgi:hypothetical protein